MHAISNFALQYANVDYAAVSGSPYDLFITEGAPLPRPGSTPALTDAQVAQLEAQGRVVAGYVNVAVTDDNRGYWNPAWTSDGTDTGTPVNGVAPAWLTGQPTHDFDGGGPDAYIVEFWDPDWTQIVIDQAVDLVNRGYNGVFLDDVGIYWTLGQVFGQPSVQTLAQHMIDLVQAVSAAIKAINPDAMVITNGNPFIGNDAGGGAWRTDFTDAIDAMVLENPSSIDIDGALANIRATDPVLAISTTGS